MQKVIHRHVWQDAIDEVERLRHTPVNRQLYARRKETIERVFADAKEKHGMRWTRYRGLKKVTMQTMLTFAALNLKKLANWSWDSSRNPNGVSYFLRIHKTNPHFQVDMRVCLQSEMPDTRSSDVRHFTCSFAEMGKRVKTDNRGETA